MKCGPTTLDIKPIMINNIEYANQITKLENKEGLQIKLIEKKPKENIYFIYEAETSKIIKDIKFLSFCENIDEMIEILNKIFFEEKAKVEEKEGKYYIELKFELMGIPKTSKIEIIKNEPKNPIVELNEKIKIIEINLKFYQNK